MLKRIELTNFKSFAQQGVDLAPLTLLVGPNASGKSNLFDALRFLQGTALDLTIDEVLAGRQQGGRETWPGIRGGFREVPRAGATEFTIQTDWWLDVDKEHVTHSITCRTEPHPCVYAESLSRELSGGTTSIFKATHAKGSNTLEQESGFSLQDTRSVLSLYGGPGPPDEIYESMVASSLHDRMGRILFFDVMPSQMRNYVPSSARVLRENAENISAVVYSMCRDEWQKLELIDWISELCAPTVMNIEFDETRLGDVMLMLVESDGTRISAKSLSDGTLRFLGLLVAIMSLEPGSILVLEEIENGLHPARINLLLEKLASETASGDRQVIATTHSPALLGALPKEHLRNVIAFGRSPEESGTLMRRLQDLPHFDEIEARRGIEQLFTTKWLERAL